MSPATTGFRGKRTWVGLVVTGRISHCPLMEAPGVRSKGYAYDFRGTHSLLP